MICLGSYENRLLRVSTLLSSVTYALLSPMLDLSTPCTQTTWVFVLVRIVPAAALKGR